MMAIRGNVVRDSIFAISAVNLLSGFLYFADPMSQPLLS